MPNKLSQRLMVFAGLLATPVGSAVNPAKASAQPRAADARLPKLTKFFDEHHCPLRNHARDFLEAADWNHLDWRLLPSISVVESGGGKQYRNNNVLGWANCDKGFPSVVAGIHSVARRLSRSRLYRHKSLDRILATYNPRPEYSMKVKSLMRSFQFIQSPPEASAN
jgi:hypothetical protein